MTKVIRGRFPPRGRRPAVRDEPPPAPEFWRAFPYYAHHMTPRLLECPICRSWVVWSDAAKFFHLRRFHGGRQR